MKYIKTITRTIGPKVTSAATVGFAWGTVVVSANIAFQLNKYKHLLKIFTIIAGF